MNPVVLDATVTSALAVAEPAKIAPVLSFPVYLLQNGIGFILPPFIDVINQHIADEKLRFWIAMLICVIVAALVNLNSVISGDWSEFLPKMAFIFTQAQIVYKTYWKSSTPRVMIYGRGIVS